MRRGFTLVELLIVIAVMGVLAGGAISIINPAAQIQKANDAKRKADLNQIEKAFEAFYQDYGSYPKAISGLIESINSPGVGAGWGSVDWAPYMANLPIDPSSSRKYAYCASGQSYYLYASLEGTGAGNSPSFSTSGCLSSACASVSGSGVQCNYGISSPNVSP